MEKDAKRVNINKLRAAETRRIKKQEE